MTSSQLQIKVLHSCKFTGESTEIYVLMVSKVDLYKYLFKYISDKLLNIRLHKESNARDLSTELIDILP